MTTESISFGTIKRVVLIGGARLLADVATCLKDDGRFEVVVFSSKRHLEEPVAGCPDLLKDVLEAKSIATFCEDNINQSSTIDQYIDDETLAIAMGAAWVFEEAFVKKFQKPLLDFMGIDLPRFRGGAHYTWQILLNNRKGCCNLQVLLGGEETFHKGPLVKRSEYDFAQDCRLPKDYFDFAVPKEKAFLLEFLNEIEQGKDFSLQPLDESQSTYYAFLNTARNGWIDWSWSAQEIERFICAFDDPYPGASTSLNGQRVFLSGATLEKSDPDIHPFASGTVIHLGDGFIRALAKGGLLKIRGVQDNEGKDVSSLVCVGDRFFTSQDALDSARTFQAVYTAKGLKDNEE